VRGPAVQPHDQLAAAAPRTDVRCRLSSEHVHDLPAEARFVAGAALVSARLLDLAGLDLEVETESELDRGAGKTGLGGSAAATAATVRAIHGLAEHSLGITDDERLRVAAGVQAHRLVQAGGSAADVIAASVGGVVWVDGLDGRDVPADVAACAARARGARPIEFARLELPPGLALTVVASGRSCATGPRVARYAATLRAVPGSGEPVRAWAAGMRVATEMFRDGCLAGDRAPALAALRAAGALLSRLGAVSAIPVFTPELRRAAAVAATLGSDAAAAKPSGAGGGDCAIALVAQDQRAHLQRLWRQAGLEPLEVDLDPAGARCEVTT
jgi:phosphomevalonate kinase